MHTRNALAVDEISKNVERELERLKAQVYLFWEKEIKSIMLSMA
jgi:hypothetical protein